MNCWVSSTNPVSITLPWENAALVSGQGMLNRDVIIKRKSWLANARRVLYSLIQ